MTLDKNAPTRYERTGEDGRTEYCWLWDFANQWRALQDTFGRGNAELSIFAAFTEEYSAQDQAYELMTEWENLDAEGAAAALRRMGFVIPVETEQTDAGTVP